MKLIIIALLLTIGQTTKDCDECHKFKKGEQWHKDHEQASCMICHTEYIGSKPVLVESCELCHELHGEPLEPPTNLQIYITEGG